MKLFFLLELFLYAGLYAKDTVSLKDLRKSPYRFSATIHKEIFHTREKGKLEIHIRRQGLNVAGKKVQIALLRGGKLHPGGEALLERITDEKGKIDQAFITAAEEGELSIRLAFVNPRNGYYEHLEKLTAPIKSKPLSIIQLAMLLFLSIGYFVILYRGPAKGSGLGAWSRMVWLGDQEETCGKGWLNGSILFALCLGLYVIPNHFLEILFLNLSGTFIFLHLIDQRRNWNQLALLSAVQWLIVHWLENYQPLFPISQSSWVGVFLIAGLILFPHALYWSLLMTLWVKYQTGQFLFLLGFVFVVLSMGVYLGFGWDKKIWGVLRRRKSIPSKDTEVKGEL